MSSRSEARNLIEYGAVRALVMVMSLLPRRLLGPCTRAMGALIDAVAFKRRRVVAANVALAYGGLANAPAPRALARASFANICRSFLELFCAPKSREVFMRGVRVARGLSLAELRARVGPGPVVVAASHFGAWEVMGASAGLLGWPITSLIRPLDNARLDRFLNGFRMRFGQRLASNRGGLSDLLAALAEGRSAAVLVDLNMRRRGAIFVDYFGVPAATAKTAALLALRSGRPLVAAFAHRAGDNYTFDIEIAEPIIPDLKADRPAEIQRLMQAVTAEVEKRVRAHPDQWLWTHRRWKTRPTDAAEVGAEAATETATTTAGDAE